MNKKEIFEFLNANKMFHLATVDKDKPRVRAMMLYIADEKGIIFHTGKMKDLNKQLLANPNVEMCFNNYQSNTQVRVSGSVEPIKDLALKKELVNNRAFLKPWIEKEGYDFLSVYRVKNGIATAWSMDKNFEPKVYVDL